MAKKDTDPPKTLNQSSAQKLLEGLGYSKAKNSKQHSVKQDGRPPITLPYHRKADYGKGLTADILRQAGVKGDGKNEGKADKGHVPRDL